MDSKDLIVLGSGPGGYVAAIRAAQLGRKVTIVERENLGGVCLNWGCIPSKALLKSAEVCQKIKHADDFGFTVGDLKIDFPKIVQRSRDVAGKLSTGVQFLMKKNKVEVVFGEGKIEKNNRLTITDAKGGTTTVGYKDIIIATGARPRLIPGVEADGEVIHTYRTILENRRMPQKLLVVGGGVIGIEFAYFFNALGVQVTVVEMMSQILPLEDTEVARELEKSLTKQGITVLTGAKIENIKRSGKTVSADIMNEKGATKWTGDTCLVSIGVVPNTETIGLDTAGIAADRGFIKVDGYLRTNVPNHFAIGDCTGGMLLAHKASHEALIAAEAACGQAHSAMHYDNIPACTYCKPQVASLGYNEQQLKEKGIKYKAGKIPFSAIGKAIAIGEPDGFIKVLIDPEIGEVLGVHIIHAEATELIAEAAIIRSHEGVAASVLETIHPHPTLSESMMEAMALALGRPVNF
jgi:dihydrolipoamide dehydrogenase